ncbi:MAG TPA: hypothetical protein VFO28_00610 [Burkholderiaceae bacterium]|nr:hypothetical protein [Burkholderiaceae bacterium]
MTRPRVASDATGTVLAVWGTGAVGRFYDPVSAAWQPLAAIEHSTFGTGFSDTPVPLLDGSGNALVVFTHLFPGEWFLASNYFSRNAGTWGQLPAGAENDILGQVPGSLIFGFIDDVQLTASTGGDFLVAWRATEEDSGRDMIRIAHFTGRTQSWDMARTLVPPAERVYIVLERIASDAMGNALVLWTEFDGTQTALKTVRVDRTGATCSPAQAIDRAASGGAADLAVDPLGNAIAIWQQFEGSRTDIGARSNIAISRFDHATGAWTDAVLAETQPGNAISPRASAAGGQALLGWIQAEGGANRVKALLQPIDDASR